MSKTTRRIQQIVRKLQPLLDAGTLTRADLNQQVELVASLVLDALWDEEHLFSQKVKSLRKLVAEFRATPSLPDVLKTSSSVSTSSTNEQATPCPQTDQSDNPDTAKLVHGRLVLSDRILFMPQPGTSALVMREYWPIQLLLLITGRSSKRDGLAKYLSMSPYRVEQATASVVRFPISIGSWSAAESGAYLLQALRFLDYPEPPLPIRLDGRLVSRGQQKVRVSPQQAKFLQILIDNQGDYVPFETFQAQGLKNPIRVKHDLLKKLGGAEIEIEIADRRGRSAYMLPESCM